MKIILLLGLLISGPALAHVPSLLLPIYGTPISSYFVGQSDISHAVYSEIDHVDDFFIVQLNVKKGHGATLIQLLTPVCAAVPEYEEFQPSALVIKGEIPWQIQGEANNQFLKRLAKKAIVSVESSFPSGKRPKFYEEFGKQDYWVGGEWRGKLKTGLYSIVVFDRSSHTGTFTLGLNEKEAWTPDLFKYVAHLLPRIAAGICSRGGFTGDLQLPR